MFTKIIIGWILFAVMSTTAFVALQLNQPAPNRTEQRHHILAANVNSFDIRMAPARNQTARLTFTQRSGALRTTWHLYTRETGRANFSLARTANNLDSGRFLQPATVGRNSTGNQQFDARILRQNNRGGQMQVQTVAIYVN